VAISQQQYTELEAELEILGRISGRFEPGSPEEVTVRRAAIALFFAVMHHGDSFEAYLANFDQKLTPEQLARLKEMGLETDS
jgi:hypothetical protein